MTIESSKAYQYAAWCIEPDNKYVPKYVKKQAEQWLQIANGEDAEAVIDEKTYKKICKILKLMRHPDINANMYDSMDDYAMFLIVAAFCTKLRKDTKIRYYQTILLKIARKNRKTFYSAVIFIIVMLIEPTMSRFFSVAPDLKLSSELKVAIKKIIKASPELNEEAFKVMRSEVRCLLNDSEYIPLAYSDDRLDGKFPKAWLADEAGAMDSYPIEAMRSGQLGMKNKLGVIISTEYPNDNNGMIDEVDISQKTLDGLRSNKRRFSLLYVPDDELLLNDQWMTNDLVIYQSNPVAVTDEDVFETIVGFREDAVLYENKRENFLCKHCNIKYKGLGVEGYVDVNKVRECIIEESPDFWRGKRVFLGLDLSQSDDNTSLAMVTEWEDRIYAKVFGFVPEGRIDFKSKKEDVDYRKLIKAGCCFGCGTEVIGYDFVEKFILSLSERYGVEVVQLGYDKWNAISTIQKLESDDKNPIECVEIKQHSSVLHMPTKLLKECILEKKFCTAQNDLLMINFQNAKCTEDTNLNKYVNKKKSSGKVDMVVALIIAICLLQQEMLYGQKDFVCQY